MNFKKACFLVVVILLSCPSNKTSELSDRVESFNESLRWASIKGAAAFMDDQNKKTLMERYSKDFQKSKIVDYSVLDVGLDSAKKTGTVLVEFSYYDESTQILNYKQELQTWAVTGRTWYIKDARIISKK